MKLNSLLCTVALLTTGSLTFAQQQMAMASSEKPQPKGALSLGEAISLSLESSPALMAERYGMRASEANAIRARMYPNPTVGFDVENLPSTRSSTGADETETTLRLGQLIELGGKRAARMAEARAVSDLAAFDYEIRRLDVLADTARSFIQVVVAQEEFALAKEATRLAETEREAVKVRVDAARTSAVELKRAEITVANAKLDEEHYSHMLLSSRKALASRWGSENAVFTTAKADLYRSQKLEVFGSLLARIGSNPDLARLASEASLREAQLRTARTKGVPDVTVTAGIRQFASENAWAGVFGVSLPLPVFNRGQADVYEALQLQSKAEAMGQSIRVALAVKLFETYQEASHSAKELEVMAKQILPAAREVLTATEEGYRQGRFSYLELTDARRTLIELRRQNITAARNYHLYQVEIDRLIGAATLAPKTSHPPKTNN